MTRFEAIELKVKRAKKHIGDLDTALNTFLGTNPYKVGSKDHPVLKDATTFFVEKADPIPPDIPVICGDAIHNLRSALDHLAWHLVECSGHSAGTHTGFPIYDPSAFKNQKEEAKFFERKTQGMRTEITDAIRAQQPYKGGNDTLWAIHDLDIVDKHHLLLPIGFTSPHFRVRNTFNIELWGWYRIKQGEDIVTITHKVTPEEQIEFAFDVVLGEEGVFYGKSVIKSLSIMFDVVHCLLSDFSPFLL